MVCSRMITWPLFSPPTPAPETSIASRMYLSPTGVRTTAAGPLYGAAEPAVGEHAHDQRVSLERAALQPIEGDDAEQLVAVDDLAPLVDRHAAVRVAVEREADVRAVARHDARRAPRARSRRSRG